MIKFFRKIRQTLLTENKFSKYFIYAIGEIILVVIGIFLALQINDWNNNRIAEDQMTSYLISLKNDLQRDTTNYSRSIRHYEMMINWKEYIKLSHFENVPTDSLIQLIRNNTSASIPVTTTFMKITNSGITQISDNDSLSQKVYEYYTTKLDGLSIMISFDQLQTSKDGDYWRREQNLYEFDYEEVPNFKNEKENRNNLLKLISEPRGRNYLKLEYSRKIRMLKVYQNIKKDAENLISEINKELEQR